MNTYECYWIGKPDQKEIVQSETSWLARQYISRRQCVPVHECIAIRVSCKRAA
jgi:hypothetical protein